MKEALQNIRQSADALIAQAADAAAVDELRVRFLGKKGELTAILKQMGRLSAEERPVVGALANEVREAITADIARRTKEPESAALADSLRKDYEVWKAVSETFEPDYPADAFLADSSRPGSGNRADGELVRRIRQTGKRWILAGGISEENLSEALRSGADILDVNSSLENFPGRKNILKLNQFMNKYHQYQGDRK